jgi:hypothetical protein
MHIELPADTNTKALEFPHFPTRYQAVVWRNWELVPVERLAGVLQTSERNILDIARGMGLRVPPIVEDNWLKRGYITIIRANWHLLPYEQLLILLGWTAEKLAYTLKEDDFLFVKLGNFKPQVEPVIYTPLSEKEKSSTEKIRMLVARHFPDIAEEDASRPFDFLKVFSRVERPARRNFDSGEPDEIILDNTWSVSYSELAGHVRAFVQKFISCHEDRWGTKLSLHTKPYNKKCITLDIKSDPGVLSESHTIKLTAEKIHITAVDEAGLLRGLQWMEKEMVDRGGPFLKKGTVNRKTRFDLRIIYSYFAVYGDPLLETETEPYPEGLLSRLSKLGINGVWLQGVLYNLIPWKEVPELSANYKKRIEGLRKLVKRAAEYGIGVYLYLNEPRSMPLKFFDSHPEWKGHTDGEFAALCTSQKPVQDYLRNAVARLFYEVSELAGIITITMSENLTNCFSRAHEGKTNCPRCKTRSLQEVIAEVNGIIAEGAKSVKPDAKILCWTWGWNQYWGWTRKMVNEAIELLPAGVSVMCISEDEMPTCIGGVKGNVIDYSVSVVGPGEKSIVSWKYAAERGLSTAAKVQFNNSWECSAVPYLPVMDLVDQHIRNLLNSGVSGLMLGWTLGGYPSINLELASQYYWEHDSSGLKDSFKLAICEFGEKAGIRVKEAWNIFSKAFKEFPFHVDVLYFAPQNFGPMNLLYEEPTGFSATMIGFPYDDVESWRGIYPSEIFEEQFKKLSEGWECGLDILNNLEKEIDPQKLIAFYELKNIAESTYYHFKSTYLQIAFVRQRDSLYRVEDEEERGKIKCSIIDILDNEIEIAKKLHCIISKDSRIGYEASNHYYYTKQDLMEKVISCEYLRRRFLLK